WFEEPMRFAVCEQGVVPVKARNCLIVDDGMKETVRVGKGPRKITDGELFFPPGALLVETGFRECYRSGGSVDSPDGKSLSCQVPEIPAVAAAKLEKAQVLVTGDFVVVSFNECD